MIGQGDKDKKALSDSQSHALVLKCSKLESRLRDLDQVRSDNHELKNLRDKQ
jgi:hypothetical protein